MRWTITVAIVLAARVATAEPDPAPPDPTPVDKPAAEKLFDEGRAELVGGHPDAACVKFEQSLKKDPRAVGTLLNLGLCNERQGKVASALALFIEAYDRANEARDDVQRSAAEEHVTALRPKVPLVAIAYAARPVAGEKLVIDDRVVARDKLELPVDPGVHGVVFTAPGRLPYETSIAVEVSKRMSLRLPALEVPKPATNPHLLAAKLTTFGGAGLVVASIAMGAYAYQHYHAQFGSSTAHCGVYPPIDGEPVCDHAGQVAVDQSRRWATGATVVGAIGVVAAGVGITLWLTAPSDTRVMPTASAGGAGVVIAGHF